MKELLCVVLGGGRGTRLSPLTKHRSKPAVPLVGKYRLIDIPVSNCLNSGFDKIYILTQFNSESLNKHITRTYKLDYFSRGFIEVMAAEQSMNNTDWFQGTADAVRRCLRHFNDPRLKYVLILSGDQLYKFDLRKMFDFHIAKKAEITIACNPVSPENVSKYGIMGADKTGRVNAFIEKPKGEFEVSKLSTMVMGKRSFLASMGIYLFNKDILVDVLANSDKMDFGKEILPDNFKSKQSFSYIYEGYWQDIGTIKNYYNASLLFTDIIPPFDIFDEDWQIFTRPRYLPPSKMRKSSIDGSIIGEGAIIEGASVKHSIIGLRSRIGSGSSIEDSIVMGSDYYETIEEIEGNKCIKMPSIGIGANCLIKNAIIDKNARIGDNVKILNKEGADKCDGRDFCIKDGIVIIEKNAVIESNTVI
ncbi:MAG: glucose-1-phosphate adenylyltransferase [Candidatus Omnitrophica bacterium]|nr:glucose-1-phosphate adenylyltransferase [Candidatus Omnitrophota bacterium]